MTIIDNPVEFNVDSLFVDLTAVLGRTVLLKCEGLNFAGSIKLKTARYMVEELERSGELHAGRHLIESSSGNLGVALSVIAASSGYRFTCVTDARCNPSTLAFMRSMGAEVHIIDEPTPHGGFLGARIDHIRELCADDSSYLWLNQYANPRNWQAHHQTTGPEIFTEFPDVDVLFIGAGTTGTIAGVARYAADHHPRTRVVGIDSYGSVNFGGPPGTRFIPGLGSSLDPQMLDRSLLSDTVMVAEEEAVRACRRLAARGFLFGGSTGTVVAGADRWLAEHDPEGRLTSVALAPDMGLHYLSTVYDQTWVATTFPALDQPVQVVEEMAG
ncbi:2,3-diaminopropionate biosynthesis protein SbnA [Micromonospora sp. NBC_00617]|uniref:2,3-diaminopropionate biosynthesis protein SbnA n=1 Tax=unclassified Micromonospora TaxID=2617518 RepID=UPI0030E2551C